MSEIESFLKTEFGQLDLDKQVLDVLTADPDWFVHGIATPLGISEGNVDGAVRRLLGRGLVLIPEAA